MTRNPIPDLSGKTILVTGATSGIGYEAAVGFAAAGGLIYTIIVAVIGAVVLTLLIRLFTKGRVTT